MANLKGKSTKNVSLIVEMGNYHKPVMDDKGNVVDYAGRYVTPSIDQSLKSTDKIAKGEATADPNPYLVSTSKESVKGDGSKYVDHSLYMPKSQIEAMLEKADKKVTTCQRDGKDIEVVGVEANLTYASSKDGFAPKEFIGPTRNPHFGKTVLDKQAAVTNAQKAFNQAQRDARTKDLVAEAEAQTGVEVEAPEAQAETPEV